jgi:hypothetical protein
MNTKTAKRTKSTQIELSLHQIGHLFSGAIPNLIKASLYPEDGGGLSCTLVLDALDDSRQAPQPPQHTESLDGLSDEDFWNLVSNHGVAELGDFFEQVAVVEVEGEKKPKLAIKLVEIVPTNVGAIIKALDDIAQSWANQDAEADMNDKKAAENGKAVIVDGPKTVQ